MVQRRREMVVSSMRMDDPKILEERYMLSARLAATDCAPRALALATPQSMMLEGSEPGAMG